MNSPKKIEEDYHSTRKSLIAHLQQTVEGVSWNEFYEIYERMIYTICRRKGLSDADAKDVRQMAAIKIHGRINTFDPKRGSFRSWIGVIVRSSIADHFRGKNRPLPTQDPLEDENPMADLPADDNFGRMWDEEWLSHLEQAATIKLRQQYSSRDCQIFNGFVKQGFKARELAELHSLTENNVNQIVDRTKKTFQEECERLRAEEGSP
jgi:RNA polymerase sigma factor (sigma-70 family)